MSETESAPPPRKGGRAPHEKAAKREAEMTKRLKAAGFSVERTPGGALRLQAKSKGAAPMRAAMKARGDGAGFRMLDAWLDESAADALFLCRDSSPPLAVLPWSTFAALLSLKG